MPDHISVGLAQNDARLDLTHHLRRLCSRSPRLRTRPSSEKVAHEERARSHEERERDLLSKVVEFCATCRRTIGAPTAINQHGFADMNEAAAYLLRGDHWNCPERIQAEIDRN